MAKVVVLGQSGCIQAKWLYSKKRGCVREKMVVLGQTVCTRAKWLYLDKSAFIRAKRLYSGKVVVFGQSCCILADMVLFGKIGRILA